MRITTKRIVCLLLMAGFMILFVCACGQEKEELPKGRTEAETAEEAVKTVEEAEHAETVEVLENQEKKEESWINHYYNRGIYFKDGYTYRQFADGLYRRGTGSDKWEPLFENPMNYGPGLTCYGDRLYFTGYQEEADVQGSGWNNTVFYYDLDTGEQRALLTTEELASTLTVYEGCLYFEYMEDGYMLYEGYRLNEDGSIAEKLDETSEDFLCYETNEYSRAEAESMGFSSGGRRTEEKELRRCMEELKKGVIPVPACAAMLDGRAVLSQYKDELARTIYLRNVESGEDTFLFDASYVIAVTREYICYLDANEELCLYSFTEGKSQKINLPDEWENEDIGIEVSYIETYDKGALYFYDIYGDTYIHRIIRVSLDDWSAEIIAEGEMLEETDAWRINQVDEEYFYHGDQMYPLP